PESGGPPQGRGRCGPSQGASVRRPTVRGEAVVRGPVVRGPAGTCTARRRPRPGGAPRERRGVEDAAVALAPGSPQGGCSAREGGAGPGPPGPGPASYRS